MMEKAPKKELLLTDCLQVPDGAAVAPAKQLSAVNLLRDVSEAATQLLKRGLLQHMNCVF